MEYYLMFGREPKPYKDAYDLGGVNIIEKKDHLLVTCTRCHNVEKIDKFHIHPDGAITFSFYCWKCNWKYDIYRNNFAEYKKTQRCLLKYA